MKFKAGLLVCKCILGFLSEMELREVNTVMYKNVLKYLSLRNGSPAEALKKILGFGIQQTSFF